jgi:hypothetical protein
MEQDAILDDLERFVYENPELERLEALLDDFNPFVALRWTHQEIKHSAFLRWLLDPAETHGLGAYFLRAFLKRLAHESRVLDTDAPSVFDIDSWGLSEVQILQESQGIDLLVRSDQDAFIAVIENKIKTSEHSEQLQRYRALVSQQFPDHRKLFAYLTVAGELPSDEAYVPIGYGEIVLLIDKTLQGRGDQLGPEVRDFLRHYVEMVRRHIVENSEIQIICSKIYEKHRRALETLFEHRPDRASEISEFLKSLIESEPRLIPDSSSKSSIRFIPKDLDFFPRAGEGWTKSNRLILFEIENYENKLKLKLILGPGPLDLREEIHSRLAQKPKVFNRAEQKLYPKWWSFHIEQWIGSKPYTDLSVEDLKDKIQSRFQRFLTQELPSMIQALGTLQDLG